MKPESVEDFVKNGTQLGAWKLWLEQKDTSIRASNGVVLLVMYCNGMFAVIGLSADPNKDTLHVSECPSSETTKKE